MKKEEEKPVNNDTVENTEKEQIQSDSTTIKSDSVSETTPFTIIDKETVLPTKTNEEETVTPSKIDDAQANASLNENELQNTTNEDDETAELTEKPEKLENLDAASSEFDKLKTDESVENEGKPGNVTTESIEQTTEQSNEKDIETQDNSD